MSSPESFRERAPVLAGERVPVDGDEFGTIADAIGDGHRWYVAGLVSDGDRVAFVRNRWSDGWVLPGGKRERDETLAEAAVREVREETGLRVTDVRPAGTVEQTFVHNDRRVTGYLAVFNAAAESESFGRDLGEDADEIEAAAWFASPPERIDGLSRELVTRLRAVA